MRANFKEMSRNEQIIDIIIPWKMDLYMKLLLDTKFDKRKDQQIKGKGERTGNTIIWKQTISKRRNTQASKANLTWVLFSSLWNTHASFALKLTCGQF